MVQTMNNATPNPFTGLKGALAGLMSGGVMGWLLALLFHRRIAPMLAALETLFAQFKAGTLPLPPAPAQATPRTPRPQSAAARACPRPRASTPRRRATAPRQPVAPAAIRPVADAPRLPWPSPRARPMHRHRARCTKNDDPNARLRTPYLLRFRINNRYPCPGFSGQLCRGYRPRMSLRTSAQAPRQNPARSAVIATGRIAGDSSASRNSTRPPASLGVSASP